MHPGRGTHQDVERRHCSVAGDICLHDNILPRHAGLDLFLRGFSRPGGNGNAVVGKAYGRLLLGDEYIYGSGPGFHLAPFFADMQ